MLLNFQFHLHPYSFFTFFWHNHYSAISWLTESITLILFSKIEPIAFSLFNREVPLLRFQFQGWREKSWRKKNVLDSVGESEWICFFSQKLGCHCVIGIDLFLLSSSLPFSHFFTHTHTFTNQLSIYLSISLSLSRTHTHTHTFTDWFSLSLSLSHTHTHTHKHSPSHFLTHSFTHRLPPSLSLSLYVPLHTHTPLHAQAFFLAVWYLWGVEISLTGKKEMDLVYPKI